MRRLFALCVAAALMLAPWAASAQASGNLSSDIALDRSVSYSYWTVEGATVRVRLVLPTGEARELAPPGAPPPSIAATSAMVGAGLAVSASGQDCEAIDQGEGVGTVYTMALTPGVERFELIFRCPRAGGLVLQDHLLFARAPGHVDYASIQRDGASVLKSFTAGRQTLALPPEPLADQGAGEFAWRALIELPGRAESLCVVAGFLLLCRRWCDLSFIAAGLGVGYGVSMALALTGLVTQRAPMAEIGVDAVVVLAASGALLRFSASAPVERGRGAAALFDLMGLAATLAAAVIFPQAGLVVGGLALFGAALIAGAVAGPASSWLVSGLAVLFGLLDGGRLASELSPLRLPPLRLAPMLAGSDLGALAATLAVAGAAMGVAWIARRPAAFARPAAEDMAGAGVFGLGVFWFVSHLYS